MNHALLDTYFVWFVWPYLCMSACWFFIDIMAFEQTAAHRKQQTTPSELLAVYKRLYKLVILNLFITHPIMSLLIVHFLPISYEEPTDTDLRITVFLCMMVHYLIFNILHWLTHNDGFLFQHIHKGHGLYAHPLNYIFTNLVSWFLTLLIRNEFGYAVVLTGTNILCEIVSLKSIRALSFTIAVLGPLTHSGFVTHHSLHHMNPILQLDLPFVWCCKRNKKKKQSPT